MSVICEVIASLHAIINKLDAAGRATRVAGSEVDDALGVARALGVAGVAEGLVAVRADISRAQTGLAVSGNAVNEIMARVSGVAGGGGDGGSALPSPVIRPASPESGPAPRSSASRLERPSRDEAKPDQPQQAEAPRWERRVDALVAYSPHGAGTMGGLAGLLLAPNKVVGVAALLVGQAADMAKTYWDRRKARKKGENADR